MPCHWLQLFRYSLSLRIVSLFFDTRFLKDSVTCRTRITDVQTITFQSNTAMHIAEGFLPFTHALGWTLTSDVAEVLSDKALLEPASLRVPLVLEIGTHLQAIGLLSSAESLPRTPRELMRSLALHESCVG